MGATAGGSLSLLNPLAGTSLLISCCVGGLTPQQTPFFPSIEKDSATEYDCMSEATSPFPNYIAGSQNFVHFKLIRYSEPTSAVSTNLELYFFANLEAITCKPTEISEIVADVQHTKNTCIISVKK